MSDYQRPDPQEEFSLDELLANSEEYLEDPQPASQGLPEYGRDEENAAQNGFFEPDFGNAFDDYGEYDASAEHAVLVNTPKRRRKRHVKKFKFPMLLKLAIYFAVVALLGVLLAKTGWELADDVLALTRPDLDVEVTINNTDTLDDIAQTLKDAGAIKYDWLFKFYCNFTDSEDYFDPGIYTINLTYDYHALVNHLMATAGTRETVTLMIVEGATCGEIFDLLEENNVCTRAALEQCAAEYEFDYEFLRDLPYGEFNRLEGYLFPDTYEFYLMDEPENVLGRFLRNFNNRIDEDLMEQVSESGYTLDQILAIASIIEGEAANDAERAQIASVIYNRLNNWEMPLLGMDSTVFYAAEQLGTSFDLQLDSPYNTYRYPGLPKGAINNPSLNSIRAALNPETTNYYYFATGVDGLNHFFTNEADFLSFLNSDAYQN